MMFYLQDPGGTQDYNIYLLNMNNKFQAERMPKGGGGGGG